MQLPLFELCRDESLERDAATGLPLKAMAAQYVANLKTAATAALGRLEPLAVDATPAAATTM